MTNKTPSGVEKPLGVFLSSSEVLAQYCVNFPRWFTHEKVAFYTEQCTTTSLFHNFKESHKALVVTHSKTMVSSLGRHFL